MAVAPLSRIALIALAALAAFCAPPAHAQARSADDLFREGVILVQRGEVKSGCERLGASYKIDLAPRTLEALADCHQKLGQLWGARQEFSELAERQANMGKNDAAQAARARVRELDARLPKLRFEFSEPTNVVEIILDGAAIPRAEWGAPVVVDAGEHTLEFRAPGKTSITRAASAAIPAATSAATSPPRVETTTVIVPRLIDDPSSTVPLPPLAGPPAQTVTPPPALPAPAAPAAPAGIATAPVAAPNTVPQANPPASAASPRRDVWRKVGYVVGGAGVVLLGAGAYLGLRVFSQKSDGDAACAGQGTMCMDAAHAATAQSYLEAARSSAALATVAVGGGVVVSFIGAILVFGPDGKRSPATQSPSPIAQIAPIVGRGTGGLSFAGTF